MKSNIELNSIDELVINHRISILKSDSEILKQISNLINDEELKVVLNDISKRNSNFAKTLEDLFND